MILGGLAIKIIIESFYQFHLWLKFFYRIK